MSAARLPLPYRDSCAHLLIPLNRCRYEEYYLPWKCEVCQSHWAQGARGQADPPTERASHIRKMPVRGIQAASRQDGGAEGRQERRKEQLMAHGKRTDDAGHDRGRCVMAACTYLQQFHKTHRYIPCPRYAVMEPSEDRALYCIHPYRSR